jgi:glycosyltransferase involved in cell wall biosynthesis
MGLTPDEKFVLFSGSFKNSVKNYPLAKAAIHHLNDRVVLSSSIKLVELKGYSPEQVCLLLNACDIALLTSLSEGSPNFIKEAMACNRPIVSTDVGDVRDLVEGIPGCFISESNPKDVADKIKQALEFENSIGARERIIDREMEIKKQPGRLSLSMSKCTLKNINQTSQISRKEFHFS